MEVDGKEQFSEEGVKRDHARDRFWRDLGHEVLRIRGHDVLRDPLADVLKQAGYVTAAIGKWHLGDQPLKLQP